MKDLVRAQFEESIETKRRALALAEIVADSAALMIEALRKGRKILVCGNGGSAADAQHFSAELVGRFETERPGLPSIALTTDSSILTAWANDYGYDSVFARQVQALGVAGDVLVGISTSGNSPTVLQAFDAGAARGLSLIALLGKDGGKVRGRGDVCQIIAPSSTTSRIQEVHIMIIHAWAKLIDQAFR